MGFDAQNPHRESQANTTPNASDTNHRQVWLYMVRGKFVLDIQLKEEDLRFIDLDATRRALDTFRPPSSIAMDNMRIDRAFNTRPTVR